ncbi:MAG: PaaI family thioesterase [bacterium]|nr:PaaI family thioesterase [bacterium]
MCCEKLPYFPKCFVCGQENPIGLKMVFEYDKKSDSVKSRVTFREDHVGYEDIIHGGLAVTVMDEAMAWMSIKKTGLMCLTESMKVNFKKAVRSNVEYRVAATVEKSDADRVWMRASIIDPDNNICASAESVFVIMKGRRSQMMNEKMKKH